MSDDSVQIYKGESLVQQGERLADITLKDNGNYTMYVYADGLASNVYVGTGNELLVEHCGEVHLLQLKNSKTARFDGGVLHQAEITGSTLMFFNDAVITDIIVGDGGILNGFNNSTATNICLQTGAYAYTANCVLDGLSIASDAKLDFNDGELSNVVLEDGAKLILDNSPLTNLTIKGDFNITFFKNSVIQGNLTVEGNTDSLSQLDLSQCELTFALNEDTAGTPFIRDWSSLTTTPKTLSVRMADIQPSNEYALAGNASSFATDLLLLNGNGDKLGIVSETTPLELDDVRFTLSNDGQSASLTVNNRQILRIAAGGAQLDVVSGWWDSTVLATIYKQTASVDVATRDLNGAGEFQKAATEEVAIASTARVQAAQDDAADVFLAEAIGQWDKYSYLAVNQFTGEYATLGGMNRFANVFCGAENDAAILMLTDGNDALFADDIYTQSDASRENRLQKLDAICAGDGNDIIDLTCLNVASEDNDSLALYGNDGDDILWGGTQATLLVGGNGDDAMSSQREGAVFAFGAAWGNDTITVSPDMDFRLWFKEGTEVSLSYDDFGAKITSGDSSVSLAGIFSGIEDKILIGAEDGIQYGGYTYGTLASAF